MSGFSEVGLYFGFGCLLFRQARVSGLFDVAEFWIGVRLICVGWLDSLVGIFSV